MAIAAPLIVAQLKTAAPEFLGPTFLPLASAIATSTQIWAQTPGNILVSGITSGVAGAGVVLGALTVPPNPAIVTGIFNSLGIVGPNGLALARVIGIGVPLALSSSAQYTGPSVGVSAGTDLSKVTFANPATLVALLTSNMASYFGGLGFTGAQLAPAIGNSIASLALAGFTTPGTGIVTPVTSATGTITGTSPSSVVF